MRTFIADDGSSHPVGDDCDTSNETAKRNLNATLRVLRGADVHSLYGETVPLDVVKITDWHPDTCGCTVQYIWRRDHSEDTRVHHPHTTIRRCAYHAHLTDDKAHHAAVLAENQGKNRAIAAAAETHGLPIEEIEWRLDVQRRPVLSHPKHGILTQ